MGLSNAISGGIILLVMLIVFMTISGSMDLLFSVGETSSKNSDLEDSILKTEIEIPSVTASAGSDIVSFQLHNIGEEKLWKFDEFDLLITYDADTGGPNPTRVTEKFTYNNVGLGLF